ncbi:hypothetical protein [Chelativorans sp. Marseille-P2723]|uniref:hypothetical protein n=1 Tax=Chelativorans sp. Marseille-P2723 TaxID=2709133 RepID=UPI0015707AC4|nr:hypothetical protein [Chelativorans sp. Marseille-P2723]
MAKRGRKSAASLEIVSSPAAVEAVERPDAPYDLTDEQAAEWWAVVDRLPADWFPRETHALLAEYCRHVVKSRRIAQLIADAESAEEIDIDTLDKLYKMAERESRAISSLATRMRISQQATSTHRADKGKRGVRKPWEA